MFNGYIPSVTFGSEENGTHLMWVGRLDSLNYSSCFRKQIKNKHNISLKSTYTAASQCKGTAKKGTPCKRAATDSGYCFQHS